MRATKPFQNWEMSYSAVTGGMAPIQFAGFVKGARGHWARSAVSQKRSRILDGQTFCPLRGSRIHFPRLRSLRSRDYFHPY